MSVLAILCVQREHLVGLKVDSFSLSPVAVPFTWWCQVLNLAREAELREVNLIANSYERGQTELLLLKTELQGLA